VIAKQILRSIVRLSVIMIVLAALAKPAYSHIGIPPHPGESPGPARPYQASHGGPTANPCNIPVGSPIDSINTYTGNLTIQDIPVFYRSVGDGVPFVVTYNSQSTRSSALGPGWTHSFAAHVVDASYWDGVIVVDENGWENFFHDGVTDFYVSPPGVFDCLWLTWYGSTWTGWKLVRPNGRELHFDTTGRLVEMQDADGLTWALSYSGDLLTTITDPLGRATSLQYDQANHLSRVTAPGGLHADFAHDYLGRLTQITDAAGDAYIFGGYLGTDR
jgi:YD repeat-containing protein